MGLFIAVMIVAWMVKSTVTDAAYAVRGQTPPRTAARLARQHSGVKSSARSGLSGYVANLWDDGWQAKTEKRRARPPRPAADPSPKRYGARAHLADRWERAWIDATDRHGQRLAERERRAAEPEPGRMFSPKAPKPVGPTVGGQPVKPEFLQPDRAELWRGDDPADPRLHEWRAGVPHVHGDFVKAPVCPSCGRPMFLNVGGQCANCAGGGGDDWNEDRDVDNERYLRERELYDGQPFTGMEGVPEDAARPCGYNGCAGTLRPVPGTQHFGADGGALVGTKCDGPRCSIESGSSWQWTDRPPAEDEIDPDEPEGWVADVPYRYDVDGRVVFGSDPTDPNGVKECRHCRGSGVFNGEPCWACQWRQDMRNADWERHQPNGTQPTKQSPNGGNPTTGTEPEPMLGSTVIASDDEYAANPPDERGTWAREEDEGDFPPATTTGSTPTTGGNTMTAPTGEIIGIESIRTTLDQFNEIAGTAIDSAAQLRTQAEAAAQAAETMAAGMSAGNVHPDTLGDVADMTEAASDARTAAEAAAAAFERLGTASAVARQGVEQRDGLVADVAQSTGNAADRAVLMN